MPENPKPGYWAVLPATVRYDANLTPNAKLLYAEISSLCDAKGYCFASNKYFALNFELDTSTIQRLIKALSDRGYVKVEVERDPKTKAVVQRRIFAGVNPAWNFAPPSPQNCGDPPQDCGDPSPQSCGIEQSNDINNTPITPKGGKRDVSEPKWKPERFSQFWDYYRAHGRGENRKAAVKAWDKLKPDDDLITEMARALQKQVKTEMWQRGVGIPYASTWLNNRRWEDDMTVNPVDKPGAGGGEECMVGSDLPQW